VGSGRRGLDGGELAHVPRLTEDDEHGARRDDVIRRRVVRVATAFRRRILHGEEEEPMAGEVDLAHGPAGQRRPFRHEDLLDAERLILLP